MKIKFTDGLRWVSMLGFIVGVYHETGIWTASFALVVAWATELQIYINQQNTKALRLLRKLHELPPRPGFQPHERN